jgi:hypothetical protein
VTATIASIGYPNPPTAEPVSVIIRGSIRTTISAESFIPKPNNDQKSADEESQERDAKARERSPEVIGLQVINDRRKGSSFEHPQELRPHEHIESGKKRNKH